MGFVLAHEQFPAPHLVDYGVAHIFNHSAQEDQVGVVNFFGEHVLPRIKGGAVTA